MHPVVVVYNWKWTQLLHMGLYIAHGNMTSWHTYMVSVCSLLHRSDMFRYYSVYVFVCIVYNFICLCALRGGTWCYVILATFTSSGNCVHFQRGSSTRACMSSFPCCGATSQPQVTISKWWTLDGMDASSAGNQSSSMEHCCIALLPFSFEEGYIISCGQTEKKWVHVPSHSNVGMDELSRVDT